MVNYFKKFNLPENYNINLKELDKQYFAAQSKAHPDQNPEAFLESVFINSIYKALKDDYLRAEHLLKINGIILNEDILKNKVTPKILEKNLLAREDLVELEERDALENFLNINLKDKKNIVKEIGDSFEIKNYEKVIDLIIELRYLNKLTEETKRKMSLI